MGKDPSTRHEFYLTDHFAAGFRDVEVTTVMAGIA
jgi:hypothetical protein